jgi:hypothetical protein
MEATQYIPLLLAELLPQITHKIWSILLLLVEVEVVAVEVIQVMEVQGEVLVECVQLLG